jgi:hypothetical protein
MSPADYILCIGIGLLFSWVLGGVILRLGGLVLFLAGAAGLAINPDLSALLPLATGSLMWLVGHWHYALRHQGYKSLLARRIFGRWMPEWLDPTAGWASDFLDREAERRRDHGR